MAYHSFQWCGGVRVALAPSHQTKTDFSKNKNFYCIFQKIIVVYPLERMFHITR
jgi:hypothetical protein